MRNGMTLAHTTETDRIAKGSKFTFMLSKLKKIPRRIFDYLIAGRSFNETYENLPGRFLLINLHELQRQISILEFILQAFAQIIISNSTEQNSATAQGNLQLMSLNSHVK